MWLDKRNLFYTNYLTVFTRVLFNNVKTQFHLHFLPRLEDEKRFVSIHQSPELIVTRIRTIHLSKKDITPQLISFLYCFSRTTGEPCLCLGDYLRIHLNIHSLILLKTMQRYSKRKNEDTKITDIKFGKTLYRF